MDYKFTAGMEEKLDKIADKKAVWNKVLKDFYDPFIKEVNSVMQTAQKINIETKFVCPNCGKPMVLKNGKTGSQFLGCSGYPECKTALSLNVIQELEENDNEKTQEICEEKCDKCGADMVFKLGPYGKYMECINIECKNRKPYRKSTGVVCPKCGKGEIVERKSKRGTVFFGCNKYPDCDFVLWNEPIDEKCPKCQSLFVKKVLKSGESIVCSKCGFKKEVENGIE